MSDQNSKWFGVAFSGMLPVGLNSMGVNDLAYCPPPQVFYAPLSMGLITETLMELIHAYCLTGANFQTFNACNNDVKSGKVVLECCTAYV
ncbi:hypothetical protein KF728_09020 [Candidatus Obscuribacterales bacterium]|nr:hypothetical protein [Candidatus Obscuribacterales bacterium]